MSCILYATPVTRVQTVLYCCSCTLGELELLHKETVYILCHIFVNINLPLK